MGIEDPEADVVEQLIPALPIEEDDTGLDEDAADLPLEADPADVAEQHVPELPTAGGEDLDGLDLPLEADPADVAEQLRGVPIEPADELLG